MGKGRLTHGGPSRERYGKTAGGILSPTGGRAAARTSRGRVRKTSLLAKVGEELGQSAQAVEVEQRSSGGGREGSRGTTRAVGRVEGDGSMAAIRQADDDSGVGTAADAHDGQSLSAGRVMGMGDGHPSRRNLGRNGSALRVCQRSAIAWRRWLPCWSSNRSSRRTCSRNNTPIDRTAGPWTRYRRSTPW